MLVPIIMGSRSDLAHGEKIAEAMLGQTTEALLARMLEEDVPVGPVLNLDEIFNDPQVEHNNAILEFDHPTAGRYHQARPAARFAKTAQEPKRRMPPLHGEHTEEVLRELGYSEAELEQLRGDNTILIPD